MIEVGTWNNPSGVPNPCCVTDAESLLTVTCTKWSIFAMSYPTVNVDVPLSVEIVASTLSM